MALRALVVGGSVGGLFAALLLRTLGWEVEVFERATDDLAGRGAGIGTRPELFAILKRCGVEVDLSMGVEVFSRKFIERDGRVSGEYPVPSTNSAWDRVYQPLKRTFPAAHFHAGRAVQDIEPGAQSATAIFADGARIAADLIIGADGVHSTVRPRLFPEAKPRYAGYYAWRGVLDESALEGEAHGLLFHHMAFARPEGELILSLPMAGRDNDVRVGHRRYHFIWFRPASEAELAVLATDATGKVHSPTIPPPLVRPEVLAAMHADADERLPMVIATLVKHARQPILQPIFDLESSRLVNGRVALLGDAAFVARPHVATGITKAAMDAECLANALSSVNEADKNTSTGIDAALARYESERVAAGRALVARARALGSYLEPGAKSPEAAREAAFHAQPGMILREYGAAGEMMAGKT